MFIGYSTSTIKSMIENLQNQIEDSYKLLKEDPEFKEFWEEDIRKCQSEIAELQSYLAND